MAETPADAEPLATASPAEAGVPGDETRTRDAKRGARKNAAGGGKAATGGDIPQSAGGIKPGDTVVVTATNAKLRARPAAKAEVEAALVQGTVLEVTGPAKRVGDTRWYPVVEPTSGLSGFIQGRSVAEQE
jgi:hypothetical protein